MEEKFTYFEVRDILNLVLFNYLDNQHVDCYRLDVLDKLKTFTPPHSQNHE
jgi:hypothetical protein